MAIEVLGVLPATTALISSSQRLQFDVRSTVAFVRVVVSVEFVSLKFREVAYEGDPITADAFEATYVASSSLQDQNDPGYTRYQFQIARSPAWPASPTMHVVAYNVNGEEV